MDSGELLERINTLIEGQKIARGDMLYRGHADAELVEAAARIRQYQARIEALETIVGRFVQTNNDAPEFGMCDCIDNEGEHYQSADLAALLIDARALLGAAAQHKGG